MEKAKPLKMTDKGIPPIYYHKDDIQLAVWWLENQISGRTDIKINSREYRQISKLIDKAFASVKQEVK